MTKRERTVVNQKLGDRVRQAREAANLTQPELAEKLNQSQSSIAEVEGGFIRRPKKLREIAELTGRSQAWLLGETDDPRADLVGASLSAQVVEVPIVGVAEAGIFRAVDPFSDALEPAKIYVARDKRIPNAPLKAYRVQGDSMVDANINDGDTVICADFMESGLPLRDKMIVVAQRTRDGGASFELTVKKVRTFRDRIELIPCSTNPKHQSFVFKALEDDSAHMDGEEVRVLGIVLSVTKEVPI